MAKRSRTLLFPFLPSLTQTSWITRSAGQTRTQKADRDTLRHSGHMELLSSPYLFLNFHSISQPKDQRPQDVFPGAELNQGGKTP